MDKVVTLVKKALSDVKAEDIVVIDVRDRTPFAEYYVICTATNKRQLGALADAVIEALDKKGINYSHVEGKPETGWVLVDAYHVIVNVFSKEERERFSLDKLLTDSKKA